MFGVWSLVFGVMYLWSRVKSLGCGVWVGVWVWSLGSGVWGLVFGVSVFGFKMTT